MNGRGALTANPQHAVRAATADDIPALARVHAAALPDDFLPSLGTPFLERAYYPATFMSDAGAHFVATIDDRVCGFVTVAHDTASFARDVVRAKLLTIAGYALAAAARRPSHLRLSAEVALSVMFSKPDDVNGEIVLIAVEPRAQGHGLGSSLVQAAMDYLVAHGCERCRTKTLAMNHRVIRMYERMGWTIRDRFRLIGRDYVTVVSPQLVPRVR